MFFKKALVILSLVSLVNLYVCPMTIAKQVTLEAGTPINLIVNNTISSELNYVGERVDFNIANDVQVDGNTVIKEGTKVIGTISSIDPRSSCGKSGHINIILNSIKFDNGKIITLYNMIERKGSDRFDPDNGNFISNVIVSIFFWPVGLYFVCSKGKETIIPANSIVTVINNRNLSFDTGDLHL